MPSVPGRICSLCGADLSGPGTADPVIDPEARNECIANPWTCLDARACDIRFRQSMFEAAANMRGPVGWVMEAMARQLAPERLAISAR
jgi:hypothetical protein